MDKDGVTKDIDEMLEGMIPEDKEPEPPKEDPPKEEPPVEEPPKEEPPKEEPPKEEPPKEEPPKEDPPKEEPPKEEPPKEEPPKEEPPKEPTKLTAEQELEQERVQTKLLLERVEALSDPARVAEIMKAREPEAPPKPASAPKPEEEPPTPPEPVVPPEPAKPIDFLGDKALEDVIDKKDGLNEILNRVVKEAGTANTEAVVERILTAIPNLVAGQIVQQNAVNKMVGQFYDANKDLTPAKRTVGIFVNEVHSEHPDWKTEDVFKEAGTRTRKALGLREEAEPSTKPSGPAFVRQRGSRDRGGDELELEGMAKDIDELISD